MLEKTAVPSEIVSSTTDSSTSSWSSYFTRTAKALAFLGGVGGIGIGMWRYLQQNNVEPQLTPNSESLSLLPSEKENIELLSSKNVFPQPIPDTSIAVSILTTTNQAEKKSVDDVRQFSEITDTQTHFTTRQLRSTPTVLNPIPDQVININEVFDFTIDVKQVFGENMEVLAISGDFPTWMNVNYYPTLGSYALPVSPYAVKVVGTKAYIADGTSGLYILNVVDLSNPILLGRYDTPGIAYDVEVIGNTAYVADGSSLQILDVTNPASVTMLGNYLSFSGAMKDIVLNGNIACVLDNAFLYFFNVSNPLNAITPIGSRTLPVSSGNQAVITQNTAYIATTTGIYTFSINPPIGGGYFQFKGDYSTLGTARDIVVIDFIAYIVEDTIGLQIINVTNPAIPTLLSTYDTPGNAWGISVIGNKAYVADTNSGLQIINVTNPTSPSLLGNYNTPGSALSVVVIGNIAYVADGNSGLQIINVNNPNTPSLLGTYDTPGYAVGITVIGTTAYVADYDGGLQIISVTNLIAPTFLGSYSTSLLATNVIVVDTKAYVTGSLSAFQIFDITHPTSPTLLGSYDTSKFLEKIYVIGTIAYVACDTAGIQIVNVANSAAPTLLASYDTPGRAYAVTLVNATAYIADFDRGLQIIQVVNPISLPPQGSYQTPSAALGIALFNNTAVVALNGTGFQLFSIENPVNLTCLSSTQTVDTALSVTQLGRITYIGEKKTGLEIFNIAHVNQPQFLGSYDTVGAVNSLTIANSMAYIADSFAGLQIINLAQRHLQGTPLSFNIGDHSIFTITGADSFGNVVTDSFQIVVTRFPIIFQPITPPKANWEQKPFYMRVSPNTFYNPDTNTNPLNYNATLSDNAPLPGWINFNATGLNFFGVTPHVISSTTWIVRITATNTLGGYVSTTFPLTVDPNSRPIVTGNIPFQYAKVNQPYNYLIPQGLFSDPDGDSLLYSARFANSTTLPAWLSFNPVSPIFSGLAQDSDVGNFTVIVSATDNIAGTASTQFGLYVSYLPQVNGNIPKQVIGINIPYQYKIDKNIFSSLSHHILTYNLKLKNGVLLPPWLAFNASSFVLSGLANTSNAGSYTLQMTARDDYQGVVSTLFDLIVEYLPSVQNMILNQVAGVTQAFSFTLPQNTFAYTDGTDLSYQVKTISGTALPNWLQWNADTQQLTGTPQISDAGTIFLQVIATDPVGGSASTSFQLSVMQFPILNHPIIPPSSFRADKWLVFTIPSDTFSEPNRLPMTYRANLVGNTLLPTWLTFYSGNLTFSGFPNITSGILALEVTATNSQGGFVIAPLTFRIVFNSAPVVANPISNLVAQVGSAFKFVVPSTTFSDPDGDVLIYSAGLSDGSPLPAWLQFKTQTFSGTPGGDDTNFYQPRVLPISLKANDGAFTAITSFNISVQGVSTGELVVKIVSPIVSGLGTAYGLYLKRHFLLNNCCKKRYQRLENTAVIGEPYSRQLETPIAKVASVTAKFQRSKFDTCVRFFRCRTNAMPGGALLPNWLKYDEATNTLRSKSATGPDETHVGTLIIQIKNTGGVIQEQFTLKVMHPEQALDEMMLLRNRSATHDDHYLVGHDVPLQNLEDGVREENKENNEPEVMRDEASPCLVSRGT